MQDQIITRTDSEKISTLTLNRPQKYNALSAQMLSTLQQHLEAIAEDKNVHVVILAGAGKSFCAGHDLKEMRSHEEQAFHQSLFDQCSRMMLTLHQLPQPVIAQVDGIATAAGCQLVANCDLAVASTKAKFAVSGINVGLFCSTPAVPLSRNISRKQAMHMLLTGDFIDADRAYQMGLVNQVVESPDLQSATHAMALKIAQKSPLAVRLGKDMFYQQLPLSMEEAYAFASKRMACNMNSEDAREGIDAFLQKRTPAWKGQ